MSEQRLYELHASICQALANRRRLETITHLRDGEKTVTELMEIMRVSQANLSQHLALMRQKGIVLSRREGLNVLYRVSSPKIVQACNRMRRVLLEDLEAGAALAGTAHSWIEGGEDIRGCQQKDISDHHQ